MHVIVIVTRDSKINKEKKEGRRKRKDREENVISFLCVVHSVIKTATHKSILPVYLK